MRILYLCHEPLPSPHTNTEQAVKSLAAFAEEAAYRIDLLSPKRTVRGKSRPTDLDGIASYYDVPREIFRRKINLIDLAIPFFLPGKARLIYFDVISAWFARKSGYDLVYTRDPLSLAFSLALGNRTLFETYRYDLNSNRKIWLWRRFCYSHKKLAGIITHSDMARRTFLQAGINPKDVQTIYNGGLSRGQLSPVGRDSARQKLGLPVSGSILLYSGRIARGKGIDVLIAMADLLKDVQFIFLGGVAGSKQGKQVIRAIKERRISNISFIPRVPPSQVSLYLSAADLLLIPPTAKPLLKYQRTVLPIKTFRYLAAGRPILAPDTPDIKEILRHRHNAVLVPADSLQEAVNSVRELLQNEHLKKHISENALKDSRRYTWQRRGWEIVQFIERLQLR